MSAGKLPRLYGVHESNNPKEWIPLDFANERGTTEPGRMVAGEMQIVRAQGSGDHTLIAGFWRTHPAAQGCDPVTGDCDLPWDAQWGDEQIYILEGAVTVKFLDSGKTHTFRAGDIFCMEKNLKSDWHVHGPYFKKWWVIAHSEGVDFDPSELPIHNDYANLA
jgi:uncharacterized cupin superfamily protein